MDGKDFLDDLEFEDEVLLDENIKLRQQLGGSGSAA